MSIHSLRGRMPAIWTSTPTLPPPRGTCATFREERHLPSHFRRRFRAPAGEAVCLAATAFDGMEVSASGYFGD